MIVIIKELSFHSFTCDSREMSARVLVRGQRTSATHGIIT